MDLNLKDNASEVLGLDPRIAKLYIGFDQCKSCALWLVKSCLLVLDLRITKRIPMQNRLIKCLVVYVGTGFITIEICYYFAWCWPFHLKWTNPQGQCGVPTYHLIMEAVLNISSDVALMLIMIPMFLWSRLPSMEKAYVSCLFGLGVFVVFCSAENKYYVFTNPTGMLPVFQL